MAVVVCPKYPLNAGDRQTVDRYHRAMSSALTPKEVALVDFRFRENHRVKPTDATIPALNEILAAHQARVAGQGSPAACDDVAKKVMS